MANNIKHLHLQLGKYRKHIIYVYQVGVCVKRVMTEYKILTGDFSFLGEKVR